MTDPKHTAVCLAYLKDGFVQEGDKPGNKANYESHANVHGGHIGIVNNLYIYAEWIEEHLSAHYYGRDDIEWPGVFHYEVTEELGEWLFDNPDHFNDERVTFDFVAHATPVISRWFVTGRLTQ